MNKSVFRISKMDCPSEERIIRMALDGKVEVKSLDFDLSQRSLTAVHADTAKRVLSILETLNLGAELKETKELSEVEELLAAPSSDVDEMSVLKKVFAINGVMFVVGFAGGIIAQSTGLLADSLDMFADATVFGLSMYAVGRSLKHKQKAARISGYLQMVLAIFALSEVIRRVFVGSEPEGSYMIALAAIALVANATCMYLLASHRKGAVHMRASWIFLSNDVIANLGVILAGAFVYFSKSHIPDLIVGLIIAFVVLRGALNIIRLSRASEVAAD